MPVTPLVALNDVSKSFPGAKALDKVRFGLMPGKVHAQTGENGAGKSTLLKIFAGMHRRGGGEMLLDGMPIEAKTLAHPASHRQKVLICRFIRLSTQIEMCHRHPARWPTLPRKRQTTPRSYP